MQLGSSSVLKFRLDFEVHFVHGKLAELTIQLSS